MIFIHPSNIRLMNYEQELGHLALAIVQAGAYISKTRCGLVGYFEMYRERRSEFLEEYRDKVQKIDNYEWTVYTTWTASFEKLSTRAATFLNICAFFHHEGISRSIFQRATTNIETYCLQASDGFELTKDLLSSFRSENGHWDFHKFLMVVTEISSYSLIDYDERNETYFIHPLVHAWTRSMLSCSTTVHECSQIILGLSIDASGGSNNIAFGRTLLPHIDASLRCGTSIDPGVAESLCIPYYECGRWKEDEKLMDLVMEIWKKVLSEDHPDMLRCMNNLASMYTRQGRWKEAEELRMRVMEMTKKVFGEDHLHTLTSMSNLVGTYYNQGRWKEAEELAVRVIEVEKRVLGEDHPQTLVSMNHLATAYHGQRRWKEAEELLMRVMEMLKQILGEDHPDTLQSMSNLASTFCCQGRWKEAEELEVRVVQLTKMVLGDDHPDTLVRLKLLSLITAGVNRIQKHVKS
jgi:tetratricopeptide (TPR) repeat protein